MIFAWLAKKAVGWLFGGGASSIAESIGNSITKYHTSTEEAASVKATVDAHAKEIATETREALLVGWAKSGNAYVADAPATIIWIVAIALGVIVLPQAVLGSLYWSWSVISTGEIQPYPNTGINIEHLLWTALGAVGLGVVKAKLEK